ncbi:MAG: hypothetical protein IPJ71_03610 [Bdellovibrionales bacterium]|nr:hypothetical protein [Bdellovibrionales bacterium]
MMPFKMDSTAPPAPLILGVSGGIDVSADRYLSGSTIPIFIGQMFLEKVAIWSRSTNPIA